MLTGTRARSDRAGEKKLMERTRGGETEVVIDGKPVFNYGRIEPFATILASMVDSMRMIKRAGRGAPVCRVRASQGRRLAGPDRQHHVGTGPRPDAK